MTLSAIKKMRTRDLRQREFDVADAASSVNYANDPFFLKYTRRASAAKKLLKRAL